MSTIHTHIGTEKLDSSELMVNLNNNFSNLNSDKIETSYLDTDTSLTANSDTKIATQKAVKTYADALVSPTGKSWNEYAVDAVGTDSYGITLTGFTAYVAGQTFKFKAGTANTGACTLNVNGLGAKTIKKDVSSDLATGDILANQIVTVIYDGTNMQMVSQPAGTKDATKLVGLVPVANLPVGTSYDFAIKLGSDFVVTNNATLQTVTGFSFAAVSGETWYIEIIGSCSASDSTGDINGDLITTGTWGTAQSFILDRVYFNGSGTFTNTASAVVSSTTAAFGNVPLNNGDSVVRAFRLSAQVVMTGSGNIDFRICNWSASAGRTSTVKAGTYMLARKLS